MKKLLTLMLCAVAVMAMVACSDADKDVPSEDEIRGEQTTKEDALDEETTDDATTDDATTDDVTTDDATTGDEVVADDETDVEEESGDEFSLGTTDGLVYENSFIGLGCTLPGDWTFYSDEEIKQLNNLTADVMGEEYEALMESAQVVYDMYATDATGSSNINVSLEKIDNRMLAGVEVGDIYAQNAPLFEEMYTSMGCSNVKAELITFDIDGEEFAGIYISAEMGGMNLYQKCFGVKCNGYLASIAITAYGEDITDTVLANFYLVD